MQLLAKFKKNSVHEVQSHLKFSKFLAAHSVAMVTYCVTKKTPLCSPVIGQSRNVWGNCMSHLKLSYEKYTWSQENSSRTLSVCCEQLCKPKKIRNFREIRAFLNGKSRKIPQLEESQILWTLKALHVILKFHIGMDDSIH